MRTIQERLSKYLGEELRRAEQMQNGEVCLDVPPAHMYVEPTNVCNHNCIMCVPKEIRGTPGFMELGLWKAVVENMQRRDIQTPCTLIGRGEPLMNRTLDQMVQMGTSAGIPCYVITNGSLLDADWAQRLLDAGVNKIQISMHAHSPEVHSAITRSKTDYHEIQENVLRLVSLVREGNYPCHVVVMATKMEANEDEMEAFKSYWDEIVDRCFVTGLYSIHDRSGRAEEAQSTEKEWHQKEHPGCTNPFCFMTLRYDGEMTSCGFDFENKMAIGKIQDYDFDVMTAFNSPIMQKLRKDMLARDFSFCESRGYNCSDCGYVHAPDTFRGIQAHIDNLAELFARNFTGALR